MKMDDINWKNIKYFSKKENFGDPYEMDLEFMIILDQFRAFLEYNGKYKMKITCGYDLSGHATKSQHYLGKAVDGYLYTIEDRKEKRLNLLDTYILLTKYGKFSGIGLYKVTTGDERCYIHIDNRDADYVATWAGIARTLDRNAFVRNEYLRTITGMYEDLNQYTSSGNILYVPLDSRFFKVVEWMEAYDF